MTQLAYYALDRMLRSLCRDGTPRRVRQLGKKCGHQAIIRLHALTTVGHLSLNP